MYRQISILFIFFVLLQVVFCFLSLLAKFKKNIKKQVNIENKNGIDVLTTFARKNLTKKISVEKDQDNFFYDRNDETFYINSVLARDTTLDSIFSVTVGLFSIKSRLEQNFHYFVVVNQLIKIILFCYLSLAFFGIFQISFLITNFLLFFLSLIQILYSLSRFDISNDVIKYLIANKFVSPNAYQYLKKLSKKWISQVFSLYIFNL